MTHVLVTGATGNVGRTVTELLAAQPDLRLRALTRDPVAARQLLPPAVEVAVGDFGNTASLDAALDGIDSVYLACANVPGQVDYESTMVDRAAAAGVSRLVKLSARGAELGSPVAFWHWHTLIEKHLAASGIPAVVLRPSFLMSNLMAAAASVREQSMLFAPAGHTGISMVDPRDVAAVAAAALVEDGHEGKTYLVTGPAAISYDEVAAALGEMLHRAVGYIDVTPQDARAAMLAQGLPPFVVDQLIAVFAALRRGEQATTTDVVATVTRRPAQSIGRFVTDHRAALLPSTGAVFAAAPR